MMQLTTSPSKDIRMTEKKERRPGPLQLFACKCPRCREGDMFQEKNPWRLKRTMRMNKECPVCGQPLDIEVGFYFGSSYVSYGLGIALSVATLIGWWLIAGLSLNDSRFFYWMGFNAVALIVLQPYLMRVSRTGWLAFFVRYDRNWAVNPPKPVERINKDQENNW